MSAAAQHRFLLRLLFDQDLRDDFFADRGRTLADAELAPDDAAAFLTLDRTGLELDADGRRTYLMSALCRSYPLTAAAVGAMAGGDRQLSAFLASESLFSDTPVRTAAFGEHLWRLISLSPWGVPPVVTGLLASVLAYERAAVDGAAAVRAALGRGETIPAPVRPDAALLARGRIRLPPFTAIVELPLAPAVLRAALDHATPEDAWQRIAARRIERGRLLTVARADPMPVTLVLRSLPRGPGIERAGAGGVAPIVEVRHVVAEIGGRRGASLQALDGTRTLAELPEAERAVARRLADEGLLELER